MPTTNIIRIVRPFKTKEMFVSKQKWPLQSTWSLDKSERSLCPILRVVTSAMFPIKKLMWADSKEMW